MKRAQNVSLNSQSTKNWIHMFKTPFNVRHCYNLSCSLLFGCRTHLTLESGVENWWELIWIRVFFCWFMSIARLLHMQMILKKQKCYKMHHILWEKNIIFGISGWKWVRNNLFYSANYNAGRCYYNNTWIDDLLKSINVISWVSVNEHETILTSNYQLIKTGFENIATRSKLYI